MLLVAAASLSYPSDMGTTAGCNKDLSTGTSIMSMSAVSSSRAMQFKRSGSVVPCGQTYVAGETLKAVMSATGGRAVYEVSGGATLSSGMCSNTRKGLNTITEVDVVMPSSSATVNLWGGHSTASSVAVAVTAKCSLTMATAGISPSPPLPPPEAPAPNAPPMSPPFPPPPPPKPAGSHDASTIAGYDFMYAPPGAGDAYKLHWAVDDTQQAVKMAVSAQRTAGYLAVGFSTDGSMVGSTAVIGWIGSDGSASVQMYSLDGYSSSSVTPVSPSPLSAVSMTAADGTLTMQFTRPLASRRRLASALDPAASEGFLWAYGGTAGLAMHQKKGAFTIKLSGEAGGGVLVPPIAKQHLSHGILMLIGWGVLLPIGVTFPAALRDLMGDPTWYRLHRAFQVRARIQHQRTAEGSLHLPPSPYVHAGGRPLSCSLRLHRCPHLL